MADPARQANAGTGLLVQGGGRRQRGPVVQGAVPHVFSRWDEISRQIGSAPRVTLLLDFDGTLAPLNDRPEEVLLDAATRDEIMRLARRRQVKIWIISGRRLKDLRERVGVHGIEYRGLHGWEHRARLSLSVLGRKTLQRARDLIGDSLAQAPGLWIEDKGAAIAVHYRGAGPAAVRKGSRVLRQLVDRLSPELRLMAGNKVWEALPREIEGKGRLACSIAATQPPEGVLFFVGDDGTDEEAFIALRDADLPDVVTVRVGEDVLRTEAHFHLRNPVEVRDFLERVEASLR